MAQAKPPITTYDVNWAKIKSWAQQEKIPTAAVNNVQALDNSRLQNGYNPMSNAERTRSILAAAGMNYNTALPTDNPGASDVIGNTIRNAQGIFTGLMPTRLFSNIWHTLDQTAQDIVHPSQAGGLGKMLENTALSWLPGAYDLGQVIQAHGLVKGLEDLAKQPLTSILDVMPFLSGGNAALGAVAATGRLDDAALAATAKLAPRITGKLNLPDISGEASVVGKALSDRLGIEPKAVAKLGAVRMAGKAIGSIHVGKIAQMYPGMETPGIPTLGQRAANLAEKSGLGKTLSTAAHTLNQIKATFSYQYRAKRRDLKEKVAKLTPDVVDKKTGELIKGEYSEFNDIMHSGKSAEQVLFDDTVSPNVRMAVKSFLHWQQWHQKLMLDTKRLLPMQITEADGTVTTAFYRAPDVTALTGLWNDYQTALEAADKASQKVDKATADGGTLDAAWAPIMRDIGTVRNQITTALPDVRMIPQNQRFLGKTIGQGGFLDQMQSAAARGDWTTFIRKAEQAQRPLDKLSPVIANREVAQMMVHLRNNLRTAIDHGKMRRTVAKAAKDGASPNVIKLNQKAEEAQYKFLREATRRAPEYRDVISHRYYQNLINSDKGEATLDSAARNLVEGGDYDQAAVDRLRRENPQRLYEIFAVGGDAMFHDPFLPEMTPADHAHYLNDAVQETTMLRAQGHPPMWVPTLSAREAESPVLRGEQVYVNPSRFPTVRSAFAKATDASHTVNDVMLGVNRATQELLGRHAAIAFTTEIVVPMLKTAEQLQGGVHRHDYNRARMVGQTTFHPGAVSDSIIENQFGMVPFSVKPLTEGAGSDLEEATGLTADELGLDPTKNYYISAQFKKQLPKLVGDQFPLHGAWDKTTGVFKWSILAISPRYTAHVLFGGGMLLALAIDPTSWKYIHQAAKMVHAYHKDNLGSVSNIAKPEEMARLFQGAAPRGTPEQDWHTAAGITLGRWNTEEMMARHPWMTKAQALANVNFKFTNYISDMQRSIAYLDGIKKAKSQRWFTDPITGEREEMDASRLHFEGLQAAERVMGNLQSMTPLERATARKIMPFYGWTKHILKYVLEYPMDHPWRTMFLSTLATQNTDNFAKGLDERLQLLLFLGQPDTNGNVTGVDVRAINPFRDVANYATFQGWISALNPIITAPFVAINPSIIYGNNELHPTVSYSQLYGTNVAAPAGGPMTVAQQFIPEFGALDYALGISAQARAVKKQGGTAQLKDLFSSLGFPWYPQQLNLQQMSAKHEIDRYQQAKTDALNAWQSGDFSVIDKYPANAQLPDPLQADYNITPAQLKKQYDAAKKRYPNLPPSESMASLPAPRL